MDFNQMRSSQGFGSNLTALGRKLLIIYGIIYVAELLLEHWFKIPVASYFSLHQFNDANFRFWQILTHPFLHDPGSPLGFLIICLVFYFFSGPVEKAFGPVGFLWLFYLSSLGGALCGLAFSGVSGFGAPFAGMTPGLLALIVVFGFMNPEATILLMFILPIKAKYISYGTILFTILTFLAKANPHGAYHIGGILLGYLYSRKFGNPPDLKLMHLKYQKWKLDRRRSRFRVIDGFKDKDDDDKPTYH